MSSIQIKYDIYYHRAMQTSVGAVVMRVTMKVDMGGVGKGCNELCPYSAERPHDFREDSVSFLQRFINAEMYGYNSLHPGSPPHM